MRCASTWSAPSRPEKTATHVDNLQGDFLEHHYLFVDSAGDAGLVRNVIVLDLGIEVGNKPTNCGPFYKPKRLCGIISCRAKGELKLTKSHVATIARKCSFIPAFVTSGGFEVFWV